MWNRYEIGLYCKKKHELMFFSSLRPCAAPRFELTTHAYRIEVCLEKTLAL
jgi:hypothetical protein